jgi:hypothetical protein
MICPWCHNDTTPSREIEGAAWLITIVGFGIAAVIGVIAAIFGASQDRAIQAGIYGVVIVGMFAFDAYWAYSFPKWAVSISFVLLLLVGWMLWNIGDDPFHIGLWIMVFIATAPIIGSVMSPEFRRWFRKWMNRRPSPEEVQRALVRSEEKGKQWQERKLKTKAMLGDVFYAYDQFLWRLSGGDDGSILHGFLWVLTIAVLVVVPILIVWHFL